MYVHICTYVRMYVCTHVCNYVCIHVCIHTLVCACRVYNHHQFVINPFCKYYNCCDFSQQPSPHPSLLNKEVFNDPGKESENDDEDEISIKSMVNNNMWTKNFSYVPLYVHV